MQSRDPLSQLRKYVADARREIAAESYAAGATTAEKALIVTGRINHLEGLVSGYLEGLAATRPDLASEAIAEVQGLIDDIHAISLTAPGPVAKGHSIFQSTFNRLRRWPPIWPALRSHRWD